MKAIEWWLRAAFTVAVIMAVAWGVTTLGAKPVAEDVEVVIEDTIPDVEIVVEEPTEEPLVPKPDVPPPPAKKVIHVRGWKPKCMTCVFCVKAQLDTTDSEYVIDWQPGDAPYPQWVQSFGELGYPLLDWHTENGKWWYVSGWRGLEDFRRRHTASESK